MEKAIREYWITGFQAIPAYIYYRDGSKFPRFPGGWKAISTLEQAIAGIDELQRANRAVNCIALKTGPASNLMVIDVDDFDISKNHKGLENLKKFGITREYLSSTRLIQTPGGLHIYMAWDDRLNEFRTTGTDLFNDDSGIDLRGEDALIFAPPTRYKKGDRYVDYSVLNDVSPASIPDDFYACLKRRVNVYTEKELLQAIKNKIDRPGYETWFRLTAGTYRRLKNDAEKTVEIMSSVFPEEKPGEYQRLLSSIDNYSGKPVSWGSVIKIARDNNIDVAIKKDQKTFQGPEITWKTPCYNLAEDDALTIEGAFRKPSIILLAAPPASCKSQIALTICSQFSNPQEDLQILGQYQPVKPTKCLYLINDMDIETSYLYCQELQLVPPRKGAWNGQVNDNFQIFKPEGKLSDLNGLEKYVKENNFELIIFDTLFSLFGSDYKDSQAVLPLISELRRFAEHTKTVIIGIHHERKKSGLEKAKGVVSDMDSVYGSVALTAGFDAILSVNGLEKSEFEWSMSIKCLKPRITLKNYTTCNLTTRREMSKGKLLDTRYPVLDMRFYTEKVNSWTHDNVRNILVELYKRETTGKDMARIVRDCGLTAYQFYKLLNELINQKYLSRDPKLHNRYIFSERAFRVIEGASQSDLIADSLSVDRVQYAMGDELLRRLLCDSIRDSGLSSEIEITMTNFELVLCAGLLQHPEYIEIVKSDPLMQFIINTKKACSTPFLGTVRNILGLKQDFDLGFLKTKIEIMSKSFDVSENNFRRFLTCYKISGYWIELTPEELKKGVEVC